MTFDGELLWDVDLVFSNERWAKAYPPGQDGGAPVDTIWLPGSGAEGPFGLAWDGDREAFWHTNADLQRVDLIDGRECCQGAVIDSFDVDPSLGQPLGIDYENNRLWVCLRDLVSPPGLIAEMTTEGEVLCLWDTPSDFSDEIEGVSFGFWLSDQSEATEGLYAVHMAPHGPPAVGFDFDECEGTVPQDPCGGVQAAFVGEGISWSLERGFSGCSVEFPGDDGVYVSTDFQPVIGVEDDFTLDFAAWHSSTQAQEWGAAFGMNVTGFQEFAFWYRPDNGKGLFSFGDDHHNAVELLTPAPIDDDTWHRYRIVRFGKAHVLQLCVDGELVDTVIDSFDTSLTFASALPFGNQADDNYPYENGWHGGLDEWTFYWEPSGAPAGFGDGEAETDLLPGLTCRAHPNPLKTRGIIEFDLPQGGEVGLKIFDVSGRLIRQYEERTFGSGSDMIVRDARDTAGRRVAAGTYLFQLTTRSGLAEGKLVVLE